jgi:Ni,Fe-hydrogenase III large subunit/Ni,Fe-hydrogenase III component G
MSKTTTTTADHYDELPAGWNALPGRVPGELRFDVPLGQLPAACESAAAALDARLATMVAEDLRASALGYRLEYVFAPSRAAGGGWLTLETHVPSGAPVFPSITPRVPAAHWHEREAQDMFGLRAEGHPDPRRLMLHDDWPEGVHPLRKDFDPRTTVPRVAGPPRPLHTLHGEGLVEIPVGPIHAGVIEPGHFRFAAVGEVVLHLEARLFYTHRGIEKLAEGKTPAQGLQLAERICGACSLSHAVAYCQAVETLAGVPAPPRAAAIRTLGLELERLYNHLGDLGNICAGVGFAVGASYGARLKEELQRLNERLFGNRFLHGVCRLGGVRRDLTPDGARDIDATIASVAAQLADFIAMVVGSESTMERFTGTGLLPSATARALGAVGVAARASGLDLDSRRDHPHAFYSQLPQPVPVVVRTEGDVRARYLLRVDEALASFALARQVLAGLPEGPLAVDLPPLSAGVAFALSESPRGENMHWLRVNAAGLIERYRVRSASYPNWPAVVASAPGNMVPDFPLINKSFELCYACLDR